MTGDLVVRQLLVGSNEEAPVDYNAMGALIAPKSGDMSNVSDLYLFEDLEIGGQLYASGTIYMEANSGTGVDADQKISCQVPGSSTGHPIAPSALSTLQEWYA